MRSSWWSRCLRLFQRPLQTRDALHDDRPPMSPLEIGMHEGPVLGAEEGPSSVVVGGRGAQQERPVWRHRFEVGRDTGGPMDRSNAI